MPGYSFGDGCGFSWQMPNLIRRAQVPLIFLNNPASKLGCYALLTMSSSQVEGKSTILVWHINECCPHDNFTSFLETLTSKLDYLGCVGRNHCFQMIQCLTVRIVRSYVTTVRIKLETSSSYSSYIICVKGGKTGRVKQRLSRVVSCGPHHLDSCT